MCILGLHATRDSMYCSSHSRPQDAGATANNESGETTETDHEFRRQGRDASASDNEDQSDSDDDRTPEEVAASIRALVSVRK